MECWRESQPQATAQPGTPKAFRRGSEGVPKELRRISAVQSVWMGRQGAVLRKARPLLGCFEQLACFLLCLGAGRVLDGCLERLLALLF